MNSIINLLNKLISIFPTKSKMIGGIQLNANNEIDYRVIVREIDGYLSQFTDEEGYYTIRHHITREHDKTVIRIMNSVHHIMYIYVYDTGVIGIYDSFDDTFEEYDMTSIKRKLDEFVNETVQEADDYDSISEY